MAVLSLAEHVPKSILPWTSIRRFSEFNDQARPGASNYCMLSPRLFSAVIWIEWFFRNSSASNRAATVSK